MSVDFLDIGGTAIRYELLDAAAPTLVLIHEMGGALESWDGVIERLRGRWRLLRYDLRGSGLSEKLAKDIAVETLADDLLALLDATGQRAPVCVAGVALGAAVALSFAARYPKRTASVAIMSPAIGVPPEARAERLAFADRALSGEMRALADTILDTGYPAVLRQRPQDGFAAFRARWLGQDPRSYRLLYRMLVAMDLTPCLPEVRCPVLGIGAELDGFRPPASVRAVLDRMPDTSFVVLPTGHHAPTQTPNEVADTLDGFFGRIARHVTREGMSA